MFDFFNKLGSRSSKVVGVFISPKSTIEVVEFDTGSHTVLGYDKAELPYDLVARQVNQMYMVESGILKMFEMMSIPLNTPTILSLPTVLMGHQTLPVELTDDEIRMALASEAERNYIFRKLDPLISWNQISFDSDADSQYLLYSAIQQEQVDAVSEIVKKIGLNLVAIDSSYAALIRGLALTGISEEEIREEKQWCTLVITQNSFVIISLIGNKIIDISEDPLAIKSFNPEDIYPNIASYSIESIINKNPEHIVIISQSNDVSSEVLCTYFDLTCKVSFIEENSFCQDPLFPMPEGPGGIGESTSISLEAVGSAYWHISDIPISFNFLDTDAPSLSDEVEFSFKGRPVKMSPSAVETSSWIGLVVTLVLCVAVFLICYFVNQGYANTKTQYEAEKAKLEKEVQAQAATQGTPKVDVSEFTRTVFENNGKMLESYDSIGSTIPEKLWIESLEVNDSMIATITGKSYSVEDIINYYQSLNKISKFDNLKISTIKVVDDSASSKDGASAAPAPQQSAPSQPGGTEGGSSKIVPPGLPELPTLPTLSSPGKQKYYEFSFASVSSSNATSAPGASGGPAGAQGGTTPEAAAAGGGPGAAGPEAAGPPSGGSPAAAPPAGGPAMPGAEKGPMGAMGAGADGKPGLPEGMGHR